MPSFEVKPKEDLADIIKHYQRILGTDPQDVAAVAHVLADIREYCIRKDLDYYAADRVAYREVYLKRLADIPRLGPARAVSRAACLCGGTSPMDEHERGPAHRNPHRRRSGHVRSHK